MVSLLLAIIYLSFISLGLPDALLGAGWPTMYTQLNVPVSYAGIIYMIISAGTVVSSLLSDRLTKKLGPGLVTMLSVATTAVALFGFSTSSAFWMLCLWAIPYGLGAGSVDASLNNYVALHYASRHMSWLHAMWGVGISVGPYVLTYALTHGMTWNTGYRIIFIIQIILTMILVLSLPLWKKRSDIKGEDQKNEKPLSLKEILSIPGAREVMITFLCYCGVEQTVLLWGSSYLVLGNGYSNEQGAAFGALFCIGITVGRFISGFMTMKFSDKQMVHIGQVMMFLGIIMLFLPIAGLSLVGLILFGLGCAPVYPSLIHATPAHFGEDKSQAVIGVQMASAYVGTTVLPPLFGKMADIIGIRFFAVYQLIILVCMIVAHEMLLKKTNDLL